MADTASRLKILMKSKGVRIKDLVASTDLSRPTISRHVRGIRSPNVEQRTLYAEALRVTLDEIDRVFGPQSPPDNGDSAAAQPAGIQLAPVPADFPPHYHGVSAARKDLREPVQRGAVPVAAGTADFLVTIDGDCMEPKYLHGQVVTFKKLTDPRDLKDGGDYILWLADGEATFKRVRAGKKSGELLLEPRNEKYPARTIRKRDVTAAAKATAITIDVAED